jgi:hypothetical protein
MRMGERVAQDSDAAQKHVWHETFSCQVLLKVSLAAKMRTTRFWSAHLWLTIRETLPCRPAPDPVWVKSD